MNTRLCLSPVAASALHRTSTKLGVTFCTPPPKKSSDAWREKFVRLCWRAPDLQSHTPQILWFKYRYQRSCAMTQLWLEDWGVMWFPKWGFGRRLTPSRRPKRTTDTPRSWHHLLRWSKFGGITMRRHSCPVWTLIEQTGF